jgi:hypothetical protein
MSHLISKMFGFAHADTDDPHQAERVAREQTELRRRARARVVCEAAPESVRSLERMLRERGRQPAIHAVTYSAVLRLSDVDLRSGQVPTVVRVIASLPFDTPYTPEWWRTRRARQMTAYALSAQVIEYSAEKSLLDTMWRVNIDASDSELEVEPQRPFVCESRMASTYALKTDLLTMPLVHTEPALDLQFSSIEAVGFNATVLYERIVERVDQDYYVPHEYPYSGLIKRVHACCAIANLRKMASTALIVETAPLATYELPHTRSHFLINGHALERAVKFIETRLLNANARFDPSCVAFSVQPFGAHNWISPWQRALDLQQNSTAAAARSELDDDGPREQRQIEVSIKVTVYFALLPPTGLVGLGYESVPKTGVAAGAANDGEVRTYSLPSVASESSPRAMSTAGTEIEIASYARPDTPTTSDDDDDGGTSHSTATSTVGLPVVAPKTQE